VRRSVSVVVPHYPRERNENLALVLGGVKAADEVIIWNNTGSDISGWLPQTSQVRVIQSHRNLGPKARFLAALAARGDLVLFQDNDVALLPDALELLVGYAERLPHSVLTLSGRVVRGGSYRGSVLVRCPDRIVPVDISLGQAELIERSALPRILGHFPFEDATRMDDLHFSAACKSARYPVLAVPGLCFRDLDMHGVGSCKQPDHYAEREALCARLFPPGGGGGG
jgi:hypothetical protein